MSGFEIKAGSQTQSLTRGAIHTKGTAEGNDLVPTVDDTAEVILSVTLEVPPLPANNTSNESVHLDVSVTGFIRTSGGENAQFFIRLDTVNGTGYDTSTQGALAMSDTFTVDAGTSYTVDLTMKSTDVTLTELDEALLSVEAVLR